MHFLQQVTDIIAHQGLPGCRKCGKVSYNSNLVKTTQAIFAGFDGLEGALGFHVGDRCTQWIWVLHSLMGICVIAGHFVPLDPLIVALTNLTVPPHAKVCILGLSEVMAVTPLLVFGIFIIDLRDQ